MAITKVEQRKLQSLQRRAKKVESDVRKLVRDTSKELVKQMKKS